MYVAGGVIKAAKKLLTKTPTPKPTPVKPSILRREAVPLNLTQVNEISKNKEFEQAWKNYKISIRKVGRRKYNKDQFFEVWARENMAQGGEVIGKPGGVVEEGIEYYGKNVMSGSPAQQANNNRLAQERFKKIGKFFITEDYTSLKNYTRKARIATGAKDAGGQLGANDTSLLNKVVFGKDVKEQNALAKKLGINRRYMIDTWKEALEFTKSGKSKSISQNQLEKIQMQKKIFDEISNNQNATVKSMAKKFKITEKQAVKESSNLLNNVYTQNVAIGKKSVVDVDSRGYSLIKSWLPDNYETNKIFLDNFSNIKGLKRVQTDNMSILIHNAYGGGKNPKKFTEAMNGLSEYNKFVNNLPEGLKLDLDHPLSKAFKYGL
jgi:hypothetical protein